MGTQQFFSSSPLFRVVVKSQFSSFTFNFGSLLYILVFVIELSEPAVKYSSRIVETRNGRVRGIIVDLERKRLEAVEVFRGIPYGVVPQRFHAARDHDGWNGTLVADKFGAVCPQMFPHMQNKTAALLRMSSLRYDHLKRLIPDLQHQAEDCLNLNVYVPSRGNLGYEAPYSVLVFIHGESFEYGSGNLYNGEILASYGNIIVITLNYRLGILGFGAYQSDTSLVITDIITALRWIQTNIISFGGNPSEVTLMGHSHGAALVNYLLLSKFGKGLFKRTILVSGSLLSPSSRIISPDLVREEISRQMACHLDVESTAARENASSNDPASALRDISNCLDRKPIEALLGIRLPFVRFRPAWGLHPAIDAEYVMEHAGENFITSELMLGFVTSESYFDFTENEIMFGLEQNDVIIKTFVQNTYDYHLREIYSAVKNEYTNWEKPVIHPFNIRDSTMEALSDGHTVSQLIKIAYLHAKRGAKTYVYHFAHMPTRKEGDPHTQSRAGSSIHLEDIAYIFGYPLATKHSDSSHGYNKQDVSVSEAIITYYANFCKTGDPNNAGKATATSNNNNKEHAVQKSRNLLWQPYDTVTQQYLSFGIFTGVVRKNVYHYGSSNNLNGRRKPGVNLASHKATIEMVECVEEVDEPEPNVRELAKDDDETLILQKLADRHYGYAAGITMSVGCLLLLLNMLIFAAIYYQKQVSSKRRRNYPHHYTHSSPPDITQSTTDIPSYYISADCDSLDITNSIMNNDRGGIVQKMSAPLSVASSSSTATAAAGTIMRQQQQAAQQPEKQINEERFEEKEMPTRNPPIGILMKHSSDSESSVKGNKPKKRVQIQTDVSIV
ncbi:neuroligin-1-like [Culicoides brevitarsis]|uniref:neuroligin-1-like n=1 Tax=Culicoides brevitarsis TaxID=469753 RepID=UPI00307B1566